MRPPWLGVIAMLVCAPALAADDPPAKGDTPSAEKAQSPSEQFRAVVKQYDDDMQAFQQAYQAADTPEAKQKVINEKYPDFSKYAQRLLKLADDASDDRVVLDALVWVAQRGPGRPEADKALARLAKDHAAHAKAGEVVQRMAAFGLPSAEPLFRAALEKNPNRETKAWATYGLANLLKQRSEQGGPDADKEAREAETLFQQVADKYGDTKAGVGTLADLAQQNLHELRFLRIGLPAPEIAGEDIDGKPMKLSDYKGKVVVLDFWGNW